MNLIKGIKKKVATLVATAALTIGTCTAAFAATPSEALTTGFDTVKSDIFGYIAIALPSGLAIFGAFFGIKKVIGFFRSVAK
jgi:hypothetical protein